MGLHGKVETAVELKESADKFYKFFKEELHVLPEVSSQNIHGVELHEGEHWHSTEAVKEWKFTLPDGNLTTGKEKIEVVDDLNKTIVFKIFGGDIGKSYENMKASLQVTEKEGGDGCIVKWTYEYDKVSEDVPEANVYAEFASTVTKTIEQHLITKSLIA